MDIYSLGRILRHYKEYDAFEGVITSIVYVGKKHKDIQSKILHKIGYKKMYESKATNNLRCIKIDNNAFSDYSL